MISFKGTHFPKDVILYAVFFYVRYGVSPRSVCVSFLRVSFCGNGWRITDNPTIERSMININPR
jgi:hypothetical protein